MTSEVALTARIAAGDEEAIACLLDHHGRALHSFILNLTGDAWAATGIFSETLKRLSAQFTAGQPVGDIKNALFHDAYALIVAFRRRRGSGLRGVPFRMAPGVAAPDDWSLLTPEWQSTLACLPMSQRAVIELRYLHRFSAPDIAQIVGLHVSRVEARLDRARARLARIWGTR